MTTSLVRAEGINDFQLIECWLAEERIWKYLGPPFAYGRFKHTAMAFATQKGTSVFFKVMADDTPVGVIGCSDICSFHQRANCWYALGDESYTGRGIIKAACAQLVQYAFDSLRLHSLYAWAISVNEPSLRILRAAGFEHYGTQPEGFRFENRFVDIQWFNRVNGNEAVRKNLFH